MYLHSTELDILPLAPRHDMNRMATSGKPLCHSLNDSLRSADRRSVALDSDY